MFGHCLVVGLPCFLLLLDLSLHCSAIDAGLEVDDRGLFLDGELVDGLDGVGFTIDILLAHGYFSDKFDNPRLRGLKLCKGNVNTIVWNKKTCRQKLSKMNDDLYCMTDGIDNIKLCLINV